MPVDIVKPVRRFAINRDSEKRPFMVVIMPTAKLHALRTSHHRPPGEGRVADDSWRPQPTVRGFI
jgi:hypothetical protein